MTVTNVRGYPIYQDPKVPMWSSELKYVDTSIPSGTSVSNTGSWTKITLPPQGVTSVTRVADRIRLKGLQQCAYFNATAQDVVRFVIIQTKGLFTSPPATTDLLSSVDPLSPYTYNARDLYEVVFDEMILIGPLSATFPVGRREVLLPRISELKFVSGSSNVYNGQLYALALANNPANAGYHVQWRLWFEDTN